MVVADFTAASPSVFLAWWRRWCFFFVVPAEACFSAAGGVACATWAGFFISVLAEGFVLEMADVVATCSVFFAAAGCCVTAAGLDSIFLAGVICVAEVVVFGVVAPVGDCANKPAVANVRARANATFFMFL